MEVRQIIKKEEKVISELNGLFWGNGKEQCCGWVNDIENAYFGDPKYCKIPENMTYESDSMGRETLSKSVLRKITITKTYDIY